MFSPQRVYITHVKQSHMPVGQTDITHTELEDIAYSQFNVCQVVISHPDAIVVKESLYENYTPDLVSKNQNTVRAKQLFPNGIPENYTELNIEQKNYLAKRSGVVTLFDLGVLSHIYKSIGETESKYINALVAAKCFEAIYEQRERLAIKYAIEAAKSITKQNVNILLIFGGIHDFHARINSYKNDNVFYAGCIETSLSVESKNEICSGDMIANLYKISNAKSSIFSLKIDEIDVSKIPSSKYELPLPPSNNMENGIQKLREEFSLRKVR